MRVDSPLMEHPTIAACLIVKNEEANILRCLRSAREIIDQVVVCDTGSTDGTIDLVQKWCADEGLPLIMQFHRFEDFATNRNKLLDTARLSKCEWLLLLDADQTIGIGDKPWPPYGFDGMMIPYAGSVKYWNLRLIRNRPGWKWMGRTHEVLMWDDDIWGQQSGPWVERSSIFTITNHDDGGSRGDKSERDVRLLQMDLIDKPNDPRSLFYLAQTYEDMGNLPFAQHYYEERARLKGFEEERWLAQFRAARLAKNPARVMRAFSQRPIRAEPVHWLAQHFRNQGEWEAALTFALSDFPFPEHEILFVDRWVYDWGLDLERQIALWYCDRVEESRELGFEMLKRDLPAHVREAIESNLAM